MFRLLLDIFRRTVRALLNPRPYPGDEWVLEGVGRVQIRHAHNDPYCKCDLQWCGRRTPHVHLHSFDPPIDMHDFMCNAERFRPRSLADMGGK